nr:Fe-S cluster assembly protein IscX [uncultured Thiodictyon sp.]
MALKWTDTREIAIALEETHPERDPRFLNFLDLRTWVESLPEFADDPARCGEKVLEAIQVAWIEERE